MHIFFFIFIFRSIISNFTNVPVTLERQPILNLDDWEDALDDQITKYSSVFEVEYDQEYVVKVMKVFLKKCEYFKGHVFLGRYVPETCTFVHM